MERPYKVLVSVGSVGSVGSTGLKKYRVANIL